MAECRIIECNEIANNVENTETTWIYWDRLKKFIDFTGVSHATLARSSGTPESTLRKLLQGVTRDPRASTFVPILRASGADANIVLGLSPARDYDAELTRDGPHLADTLRARVLELQQECDNYDDELTRLRKMVLEKAEAKAHAESRVVSLESMIETRDRSIHDQISTIAQYECRLEAKRTRIEELGAQVSALKATVEAKDSELSAVRKSRDHKGALCRRLIAALCIIVALFVTGIVYAVWEISNIDKGMTAIQLEAYLDNYMESRGDSGE